MTPKQKSQILANNQRAKVAEEMYELQGYKLDPESASEFIGKLLNQKQQEYAKIKSVCMEYADEHGLTDAERQSMKQSFKTGTYQENPLVQEAVAGFGSGYGNGRFAHHRQAEHVYQNFKRGGNRPQSLAEANERRSLSSQFTGNGSLLGSDGEARAAFQAGVERILNSNYQPRIKNYREVQNNNEATNNDPQDDMEIDDEDDSHNHRFSKSKVGISQQKKKNIPTPEEITEKQATQELFKFVTTLAEKNGNRHYVDDATPIINSTGLKENSVLSHGCGYLFGSNALKSVLQDCTACGDEEGIREYLLKNRIHPQIIGASVETMVSGGSPYYPPDPLLSNLGDAQIFSY